jgi:hypothetical protein
LGLAGLIGVSVLVRGLGARGVRSPWILPDELIYSDLARSFATTAHLAIRGAGTTGYSVGYPLLLSGAFVHRDPVAAYAAAKWLNAILMSLATVPIFLLARRLVPNALALLVAALSLFIPALVYAGVLMSENAFYPVFMFTLLAMVRAVERPTAGRQILLLILILAAFLVRAQALILLPAFVLAIVLLAATTAERNAAFWGNMLKDLQRFWVSAGVLALACVAGGAAELMRGKSPSGLLGVYATAVRGYPLSAIPKWIMYHVIDLEFYVGVIPFVPAVVVAWSLLRRSDVDRSKRALAAVAVPVTALVLFVAAAVSSVPQGTSGGYTYLPPEVHDRYVFYVVPFFLIFFVGWLYRRAEFSNRALIPLTIAASALPLLLPYAKVHTNAGFDALALLPWHNPLVAERNVPVAMAVTVALCSVAILVRRQSFVLLHVGLATTGLWMIGLAASRNMEAAALQIASSRLAAPSWVDGAVPHQTPVGVLWTPTRGWTGATTMKREQALWKAEFFNSSIKQFTYLGTPMHYGLPQLRAHVVRDRLVVTGTTIRYRYVLAAAPIPVAADVVARDLKAHLTLYELRKPSLLASDVA